ncbi:MAG: ATP synthase F0 subunit B [Actinomycetota bacterium]|nr:ATP synthase F0 subunit B [Actinomycetota bacterium]
MAEETTVTGEELVGEGETHAAVSKDPGPIVPEVKELAWGAGSFIVFALLMRFVLFPKVKKGMDARYNSIRSAHESADTERADARAEVAAYEAQLAAIKAESAKVVEAARATLESERQAKLAEVNAGIAERRAAATAQAEAARTAARDQIHAAVSDVAGRAGELATGRRPAAGVVERVVNEVMAR